jgi:hypothetical protein
MPAVHCQKCGATYSAPDGRCPVCGATGSGIGAHDAAQSSPPHYDRKKWAALVQYDEEVAAAAAEVRPLGQKWLDELAAAYLTLSDKTHLPSIVFKIVNRAHFEEDARAVPRKAQSHVAIPPDSFNSVWHGNNSKKDNPPSRNVGPLLGVGILFLPPIFAWCLLRSGYTTLSRVLGLGWLGLFLLIAITTQGQSPPATAPVAAADKQAVNTVGDTPPVSKTPEIGKPFNLLTMKEAALGCKDRSTNDKLTQFAADGDKRAWVNYASEQINAGNCINISVGTKVYLDHVGGILWSASCVRPQGETTCYWVESEEVN